MDTLQKTIESVFREWMSFKRIGATLIKRELEKVGIILTDKQMEKIEAQLENVPSDTLSIRFTRNQLREAKLGRTSLQSLSIYIDPQEGVEICERIVERIPEVFPNLISETADIIMDKLRSSAPPMLRVRRKDSRRFASRISRTWKHPLDLLEMFLVIVTEAGDEFNRAFRPSATKDNDFVFDVLIRLHARGCQIGSEVLTLLKNGFADGAHARWRTLHEMTVVAFFIAKHGNDTAEQYLLHNVVESFRAAKQYQDHCTRLGYEPLTEVEFDEIEATYNQVRDQFGPDFGHRYGWAAEAIGKRDPSFADIEQDVELEHWRPFYKLASHNVHANPKGVLFKLGLSPSARELLLAGASNEGLADPGHAAAISLCQLTTTLLTTEPNADRLVICTILQRLIDEIGQAFLDVHNKLSSHHES